MFHSRSQLKALVDGYLRSKSRIHYEAMLSLIIVEYLLFKEYFEHCNTEKITISDDKMTITNSSAKNKGLCTCYGYIKIHSFSRTIHHWKFKIIKQGYYTAIGIDETKYLRKDCGPNDDRESKSYGQWSDGEKSAWNMSWCHSSGLGAFVEDDTVEMILDLNLRTLSYAVNDGKQLVVFDQLAIDKTVEYSMAVTLYMTGDVIQLLGYYQS
eukprot:347792_1